MHASFSSLFCDYSSRTYVAMAPLTGFMFGLVLSDIGPLRDETVRAVTVCSISALALLIPLTCALHDYYSRVEEAPALQTVDRPFERSNLESRTVTVATASLNRSMV